MKINLMPFLAILATTFYANPAKANLGNIVKAAVATEIATNPALSRDQAVAWTTNESENLVNKALVHVAPWAVEYVEPLIVAEVATLAGNAYDAIVKALAVKGQTYPGAALE